MGSYKLITPPTEYPVTLDELVAVHIKVDDTSDEATLIQEFIAAATERVEDYIQRQLMQAVWEYQMKNWDELAAGMYKENGYLRLDKAPLVAIESVKYYDGDNAEQTMNASDYQVDTTSLPGFIRFIENLPTVYDRIDAIKIRFKAGYGADGNNATLQRTAITSYRAGRAKIGILRAVADFYVHRQDQSSRPVFTLSSDIKSFLNPLRLYL
jgi:uncharacterized phiE125 gp8 family phage protein